MSLTFGMISLGLSSQMESTDTDIAAECPDGLDIAARSPDYLDIAVREPTNCDIRYRL